MAALPAVTPEIQAIREVRSAAHKLDAACTQLVGSRKMAIAKAYVDALAEEVPPDMLTAAKLLQDKLDEQQKDCEP